MKRLIYIFTIILVFSSCEDLLDVKPLDKISDAAVFKDEALLSAYINDLYIGLGFGQTQCLLACFTDEMMAQNAGFSGPDFNNCNFNSTQNAAWTSENNERTHRLQWGQLYRHIRTCNVFFDNIEDSEIEEGVKTILTGEVHFFRAQYYHYLTSLWGGVPILDRAFALEDDHNVPRNSYEDCIDFIIKDLDAAIDMLPVDRPAELKGRITKGAAMTLKSRVLLYAASELHHNTDWAGSYSNKELIAYQGANRTELWTAARDAARAIIDSGFYQLVNPTPAADEDVAQNIRDYFLTKIETAEDIFVRYFNNEYDIEGAWFEYSPNIQHYPTGYNGWGQSNPTQNLVDEFEMRDGSKFSWDNAEHAAAPYENRDPRFYASINHHGSVWKPRPVEYAYLDPIGILNYGAYQDTTMNDGTVDTVWTYGLEHPSAETDKKHDATKTGYHMRKWIDPSVNTVQDVGDLQVIPWRFMRYAEVLLNYAEACIELGEEAEAITHINMIRVRAGMPELDGNLTGDALEAAYRHERKIELLFEEHRFFDIRRWMIGPEAYVDAMGVDINFYFDAATGKASTTPTLEYKVAEERSWLDRAYYFPIYYLELNKNTALVQNPLYQE